MYAATKASFEVDLWHHLGYSLLEADWSSTKGSAPRTDQEDGYDIQMAIRIAGFADR